MNSLRKGGARLLFDLQACQTIGSGPRGVGRYSHSLFKALGPACAPSDLHALLSSTLTLTPDLAGIDPQRIHRLPSLPQWNSEHDFLGGSRDSLDAAALSSFISPLKADVVHVAHPFEGYSERVPILAPGMRAAGQLLSATLYDLIPLLFGDAYLGDTRFRKWYLSRLAWLRQADLLLAISDATRNDAIELLGIEPWRIVTVHGGIEPHFRPEPAAPDERAALARRHGLGERFVLYAGGDDHRKNLQGAVAGYARVPAELRRNCQLVVVCTMDGHRKSMHEAFAKKQGLAASDVLFTGFVSEDDLAAFYRSCDAFVFPSLYEGLGLPVLEAMRSGAPVIGGDNSSIRELIGRSDALFDAASESAVGDAIARVLSDSSLAADLRRYGVERAREFTWERTALLAADAIDEGLERVRDRGVRSAQSGWIPRRRIAVCTPLPPCRSGVADYSARFLPYLARHFDIDLYVDGYAVTDPALHAAFRIFQARDLDRSAHAYDAILYEVGNSEFHSYMLPLLEKHRGIVGLHDAYLSGLLGHLDFATRQDGSFAAAMIAMHGPRARRRLAPARRTPESIGDAMVTLPGVKRVLDHALGVVSHSPFNRDLARDSHPEAWQAPFRIIPQMVPLPRPWVPARRAEARRALSLRDGSIVVTTFGHIAWTKWGDRLLQAMLDPRLSGDKRIHLVFAGEMAGDDFGRRLTEAIRSCKLGDRMRVTGYLSDADYQKYLRITDVAIQLRTKSRGGTPKGVLDCLAHGVPVVVNEEASYRDYPAGVVTLLPADPDPSTIASALAELCADEGKRTAAAQRGLEYVRSEHDPEQCAARYACAIHEFIERQAKTQPAAQAAAFAPHIPAASPGAVEAATDWMERVAPPHFERRRLFVDVSHIAAHDHGTGIQRVVTRTVEEIYCSDRAGFEPVAVELTGGALRLAASWLERRGLLVPQEIEAAAAAPPMSFRPGDVLLMLDSSWERYAEFHPVFAQARAAGVPVWTAVYDLLPILLPKGNFVRGGPEWFEGWFRDAARQSDGLVCISNAVAEDVRRYVGRLDDLPRKPRVDFWHLGANFASTGTPGAVSGAVTEISRRNYLLMVGTIEPRKSHAVALKAMERLWSKGLDLDLCIAGKEGWLMKEFVQSLRTHPQLGKRLHFLEQPADTEIDALYSKAAGLLFLSKGEGFGLPLVEAAGHGTPILCSDIPSFREVAGAHATYVDGAHADTLAGQIMEWSKARSAGKLPDTKSMPRLDWEQSAAALLRVLLDGNSLPANA